MLGNIEFPPIFMKAFGQNHFIATSLALSGLSHEWLAFVVAWTCCLQEAEASIIEYRAEAFDSLPPLDFDKRNLEGESEVVAIIAGRVRMLIPSAVHQELTNSLQMSLTTGIGVPRCACQLRIVEISINGRCELAQDAEGGIRVQLEFVEGARPLRTDDLVEFEEVVRAQRGWRKSPGLLARLLGHFDRALESLRKLSRKCRGVQ